MVGLSARALSQSARAGGYRPLAADFFCDLDTREAAEDCARIESSLDHGFEWPQLFEALKKLSAGKAPIGIVYGSGFEDRSDLLDRLAERWPLLGNSASAVRRVTEPETLAELCDQCSIPHPRWSYVPEGEGWLSKQVGGAGGSHIAPGDPKGVRYWQERVEGDPVSALVLADSRRALVLGLSSQWSDPWPDAPFRYGGAVRPADIPPATQASLVDAAQRVTEAAKLVGLNSVDFLVAEDDWHLIEINPRPGATLDIFRPAVGSLFALHVEACHGRMPPSAPTFADASAARIVYAGRDLPRVPDFSWPDWSADRQPPGTEVRTGAPLCTVLADAATALEARQLVEARGASIADALSVGP